MDLLLLGESDLRRLLDLDQLLEALAAGFMALSDGKTVAPGRTQVSVPHAGFLLTMAAWQPGNNLAVKMITGFPGNPGLGLPAHQALICVFDPRTGTPVAVMDGTYVTAMRTAAGAALSARLLARQEARVLTLIGAGVQGRSHLTMLPRARPFEEIRVVSRSVDDARRLAATHPTARAMASPEEAVRGADVVCLCTTSSTPVIEWDWLAPGTHVTSVGYSPPGSELPGAAIHRGRLFVETRLAFAPTPVGCPELAGLNQDVGTELGEVLLGRRPGRRTEEEITVYKSMGHAMEDMVAADMVYRAAIQEGGGLAVKLAQDGENQS